MRSSSPACWRRTDDQRCEDELEGLFAEKGDILKHQLTFKNCGMTFKPFKDAEDFVKNYPFAPYQFQLVQKIFEAIRKVGATGLHLARGERSMLDAFQSAAKTRVGQRGRRPGAAVRVLPVHRELPRHGGQEDHRPGRDNASLEAVRHQPPPGPVPDPLRGRDQGQRRQPRDAVPGPDRRRPPGPAPQDRGSPGPAGEGNARQPQRRQLLLPDQRGTGHQPGDQGGRTARRRGGQARWARSSSRTC